MGTYYKKGVNGTTYPKKVVNGVAYYKMKMSEEPQPVNYKTMYLTIESLEDSNDISVTARNASNERLLYYSTDNGVSWNSATTSVNTTNITTLDTGDKLLLKYTKDDNVEGDCFGSNYIYGSKTHIAYGNVASLYAGDSFNNNYSAPDNALAYLFYNDSNLISAENLAFDSFTTLGEYCYRDFFRGCSSMTTAPKALPSMNLAKGCYYEMFYKCEELLAAPDLQASQTVDSCYGTMFYFCRKMSSIKISATNWYSGCSNFWFYNVSTTGTFTKPAGTTLEVGYNGIPNSWTVINI